MISQESLGRGKAGKSIIRRRSRGEAWPKMLEQTFGQSDKNASSLTLGKKYTQQVLRRACDFSPREHNKNPIDHSTMAEMGKQKSQIFRLLSHPNPTAQDPFRPLSLDFNWKTISPPALSNRAQMQEEKSSTEASKKGTQEDGRTTCHGHWCGKSRIVNRDSVKNMTSTGYWFPVVILPANGQLFISPGISFRT